MCWSHEYDCGSSGKALPAMVEIDEVTQRSFLRRNEDVDVVLENKKEDENKKEET